MLKVRLAAFGILVAAGLLGYFVYHTEMAGGRFAFKLGLDLRGGTHLVYTADISQVPSGEIQDSLDSLRDVIERRVNLFGVAEPLVQLEQGGVVGGGEHRLIVELPGVTDVNQAIKMIGETPLLEFKLVKQGMENNLVDAQGKVNPLAFEETGLTGKYLKGAQVDFGGNSSTNVLSEPQVRIEFNGDGATLFGEITKKNVGRFLAIFLDGALQSTPVIRQEITGGSAVIQGNFTPDEAKALVRNLNFGALPVPIALDSTQTIGATLGERALNAGAFAGMVGLALIALFMILWYRLPGVVSVAALVIYLLLMLAVFKLIPVTLTAAGIAGFILSIGLAVDANILIAERMKEELARGKNNADAIKEGFGRAWTSIRDANITHVIAGVILFWFGTSLIQGFALVLILGTVLSMLSAISISRTFLVALGLKNSEGFSKFLMRSGIR